MRPVHEQSSPYSSDTPHMSTAMLSLSSPDKSWLPVFPLAPFLPLLCRTADALQTLSVGTGRSNHFRLNCSILFDLTCSRVPIHEFQRATRALSHMAHRKTDKVIQCIQQVPASWIHIPHEILCELVKFAFCLAFVCGRVNMDACVNHL